MEYYLNGNNESSNCILKQKLNMKLDLQNITLRVAINHVSVSMITKLKVVS